jgi:hypothetical protein
VITARPLSIRNRVRIGTPIAVVSAVALLGLMFATWYAPASDGAGEQGPPASAWQAFSVVDVLLAVLATAAAGMAVLGWQRPPGRRFVAAWTGLAAFGATMTLTVFYRLIDPPGDEAVVAVRPGAYLGLVATAAVTLAACLTLSGVRIAAGAPAGVRARARLEQIATSPPEVGRVTVGLVALALATTYLVTRASLADRLPYFFDEGIYAVYAFEAAGSLSDLFLSFSIGREPLQIWLGVPLVELGVGPLSAMRVVSVSNWL